MAYEAQKAGHARWCQMTDSSRRRTAGTAVSVLVVLTVGALVIPLPGPLLDLLLSANLAASLAVFALMLMISRPEQTAGLPGLLVVSSLLRVTLAVAVGRHILTGGSGGMLVSGLGELATGGSWVLGIFLVLMLAVIDMVVIGVGMVRVSEVLARFALDALPGRQMAVDTAASDGRLDAEQAALEQQRIDAEGAFYGAMDGAARFLRGDCIATLVIVAATPVAALVAGSGREVSELLSATAGHGLVILIPSLLIGGAGAVALSRAGASESFGLEIAEQLVLQPAALVATSVMLLAIALVAPGARLPLMGMALAAAVLIVAGRKSAGRRETETGSPIAGEGNRIEVGMGLVHLIGQQEGLLAERLGDLRRRVQARTGLRLAPFTLSDSEYVGIDDVSLTLREQPCARCTLKPGRMLAVGARSSELPGAVPARCGPRVVGAWIRPEQAAAAVESGYASLDCLDAIFMLMEDRATASAASVIGTQDAAHVLERVCAANPALGERARAAGVDAPMVLRVCRALLAEGVGVHAETAIVEAVCDASEAGDGGQRLVERVRKRLANAICSSSGPGGVIHAIEPAPALVASISESFDGEHVAVDAEYAGPLADVLSELGTQTYRLGCPLAVLCSPSQRPALGALLVQSGQPLMAIAHDELAADYRIEVVSTITEQDLARATSGGAGIEE